MRHSGTAVLWRGEEEESSEFLCNLRTKLTVNAGWRPLGLSATLRAAVGVSVEMAVVALFVVGYLSIEDSHDPLILASSSSSSSSDASLSSYIGLLLLPLFLFLLSVRSAVALLAILYVLTPLLASLARPVSDDTVAVVTALLLILHLFSYDYFASSWDEFHAPVSTNSGLLAAILLCSRMSSYNGVLAVVVLGLTVFALWPFVCTHMWSPSRPNALVYLALFLCPFTGVYLFWFLSEYDDSQYLWCAHLYFFMLLVVNGIAPIMFYRLQRLRNVMQGQWTEATVKG